MECASLCSYSDMGMRSQIFAELVKYKDRMLPFMPGHRIRDKERAFFVIFSTMSEQLRLRALLPDRSAQEKVLASIREFFCAAFEAQCAVPQRKLLHPRQVATATSTMSVSVTNLLVT
jgi:hypothetical protein